MSQQTKPQTRHAAFEPLEDRKLFASAYALGINANKIDKSTYDSVVQMLRDTGTKTVRVWYGFSSYDTRTEAGIFKYIRKFKNDGFDVMLAVVPQNGINPSSADKVKGLFNWLMTGANLRNYVDRWEVGNEPDRDDYWKGTPTSYVEKLLKPAAEVLRSYGEKVVSAGPSWNPEHVKQMVQAGMLDYVDYVGYHPYRNTVEDLKTRIAQVKSYANGKPLIASEWNIRGRESSSKSYWAEGVADFWPIIRDNFFAAYYYAAIVSGTMAGPAGLIYTSGSKNEPFYSTYKTFKSTLNGGSSDPVDPAPSTGNTASSLPSVSAIQLWDANSDKVLYSSITDGMTIDLAKLSSSQLGFTALTSSGTKSVRFTRDGSTRTEGISPFSMYGDQNNGKDILGRTFTTGKFTFSVQAFSGSNATGTASTQRTFTLNFINSASNTPSNATIAPAVSGFTIVDGKTGVALAGLSNITSSTTIKLASLTTRNIQILAIANGSTESVKISWTGRSTRVENSAPYEVFANSSGTAAPWYAVAGTYTLSATPYSQDKASGTAGSTRTISITFA